MPTLDQMYNGIYSAYDPSIPPIPPQQPAMGQPAAVPQPNALTAIEKLYEGIYTPEVMAWDAAGRPSGEPALIPQGATPSPGFGLTTDLGGMPSYGALANMFPSSRAQTETVPTRPPGVAEYGVDKGDQERLLPGVYPQAPGSGVGQPPATRRVASIDMGFPPLPRARPERYTDVPSPRERPSGSILSQLFAPQQSIQQPQARPAPLRVSVNGAGSYRSPAVTGFPTPVEQRPAERPANPANYNPAQLEAVSRGQSSYSPGGGGAVMPTRAMNGKLRYTYGDSSSGGSLSG